MQTRRTLNPMAVAAEGAAKLPAEHRKAILSNNDEALAELAADRAHAAHIKRLSHALLVADALARIAPLARNNRAVEIAAGMAALAAITLRQRKTYAWHSTQDEIIAISDALAVHAVQIDHASLREMEHAAEIVEAMRRGQNTGAAA
jgi:hypothetical protein